MHLDERSLAEFAFSVRDIKSIGRTCSAARAAVNNDPCWRVDVFGHTDDQVQQWPLFSPAELYDLGPGTVIWAWVEKKWYRGTLSSVVAHEHAYRGWIDTLMVAFDDGQLERWRTVVAKCLKRQRLRVEQWNC